MIDSVILIVTPTMVTKSDTPQRLEEGGVLEYRNISREVKHIGQDIRHMGGGGHRVREGT